MLRRAVSNADFFTNRSNIFAHQLSVFSVTIIISYTSSSGGGSTFATTRSVRRTFFANRANCFRSPAECFLSKGNNFLYEFNWQWTLFCYGAQRLTRIFFADRAKYARSPAGCFLNKGNDFFYEFKWRWTFVATTRNVRR